MSDPHENATIVTTKAKKDPFARVPKDILDRADMSWKAKGILAYLLSKPSDWKCKVWDIVQHGTDGRDGVRAGLTELKDLRYAKVEPVRAKGTPGIVEWVWTIADSPIFPPKEKKAKDGLQPEKPGVRGLQPENQQVENQQVEIPTSTEGTKNEKYQEGVRTEKEGKSVPQRRKAQNQEKPKVPENLSTSEFSAAWDSWVRHREQMAKGKPMTNETVRLQFKKMSEMGVERAIIMIEHSISRGWSGLFEPRAEQQNHATRMGHPNDPAPAMLSRETFTKTTPENIHMPKFKL